METLHIVNKYRLKSATDYKQIYQLLVKESSNL